MSRRGLVVLLWALSGSARSVAGMQPDAGTADRGAPTALERRTCEHDLRLMDEPLDTKGHPSQGDMARCVSVLLRQTWNERPGDENDYERWLECKASSASPGGGKTCDAILYKHLRTTPGKREAAFEKQLKDRVRKAVAALVRFREKGLISAPTFKQIDAWSRGPFYPTLLAPLEDARQLLQEGRVRPGTQVAIYPHEGVSGVPEYVPKGERAGDLAFVDARSGKRVVRFSALGVEALSLRIWGGEVGNALAWVGDKPEARAIEVSIETTADWPARVLLTSAMIEKVDDKLGKRMPRGLARMPLLVQGDTAVSYESWLALAAQFHARGLDKEDRDSPKLAAMVTLADLERTLGSAR